MTPSPVELLESGRHSLAIVNNGTTYVFDGRGVADLFSIYKETPGVLFGASLADKVVGKGAAALMVLGGVVDVYALVISEPALRFLQDAGVDVRFDKPVAMIINRSGTGPCPVESLCRECSTPQECLPMIEGFLHDMKVL